MIDTLKELCALRAVANAVEPVRDYIRAKAEPLCDEIKIDNAGNLLAFKKGKNRRTAPVMLVAHMDESGARVQKIREDGMILFAPTGTASPLTLFGSRVHVGPEGHPGVIMTDSMARMRDGRSLPSPRDYFIDLGASDAKRAGRLAHVGDVITYEGGWREMANGNIKGRALESRIGCAVMLELIKEELEYDTWFVFTSLDSIKARNTCGRGAMVAASWLQPKSILFIEAREAFDFSMLPAYSRNMTLGEGCAVMLADRGACYTRPLRVAVTKKADALGVRYQYPTALGTSLVTSRMTVVSCESATSMCAAAPVRYMAGANGVACKADIEALRDMARIYMTETEVYDV